MQKSTAGLLTVLIPVFGLGFLLLCAAIRPAPLADGSLEGVYVADAPTEEFTVAPASLNPTRILMLENSLRHYRLCLARARRSGAGTDRAYWSECLEDSINCYNSAAEGTNPSVFRSSRFPRRLQGRWTYTVSGRRDLDKNGQMLSLSESAL